MWAHVTGGGVPSQGEGTVDTGQASVGARVVPGGEPGAPLWRAPAFPLTSVRGAGELLTQETGDPLPYASAPPESRGDAPAAVRSPPRSRGEGPAPSPFSTEADKGKHRGTAATSATGSPGHTPALSPFPVGTDLHA